MRLDSPESALSFAAQAHAGQVDKLGVPYILHVARVGAALWRFDPEFVIAGFLHDVVEDTDYTLDDLADLGASDAVVSAVDAVTKTTPDRSIAGYEAFIREAADHPIGRYVKAADVADNAARQADVPYGPLKQRLAAKSLLAEEILGSRIPGWQIGSELVPPVSRHLTPV